MRKPRLFFVACLLGSAAAVAAGAGCSSSTSQVTTPVDAGGDVETRVLACPPATDAGAAAAAEAGVTVKIITPVDGQKYTTTDKVQLSGTGSDPKEGTITDPTRMIWNLLDDVKGPNPDGDGPMDVAGPFPAGTYKLRFDVSNKACVTAAATVTIVVQ